MKKKKAKLCEKQFQEEKPKARLERDRKAARITIESIKRTVHFDDAFQEGRDFLASLVLRVLGKRVYIFYVVNKLV
ncbi:hypothetical protein H5410_002076 [Solanum commersonii]|uniref:Uncharacterized protein n=1 Tax=Solanum commersonii TaxID=4109 RepID=A0A9J6B1V5_SOLCO|nr:hypothetical protein H5410_002076 [Solanum commersonii]